MVDETDDSGPDESPDDLFPETLRQTVDAADPKLLRKRRLRTRLEAKKGAAFWNMVLSTHTGRHETWRVMESCHTFEERFACGPNGFPQSEATWFHAGEQAFGQRFFKMLLRVDPEHVIQMLQENDPTFVRPPAPPQKQQDDE